MGYRFEACYPKVAQIIEQMQESDRQLSLDFVRFCNFVLETTCGFDYLKQIEHFAQRKAFDRESISATQIAEPLINKSTNPLQFAPNAEAASLWTGPRNMSQVSRSNFSHEELIGF
jgi:hypothetical protein